MYKTSTELIDNELNKEIIRPIYNIFNDAVKIYSEIIKNDFYKSEYNSNILGRLLNYTIQRHFDKEFIPNNFIFSVKSKNMPCNQKRVELNHGNLLLTISKVKGRDSLPKLARYKEEYSKSNFLIENQLMLDLFSGTDGDTYKVIDKPYYGIIAYDVNDLGLEYLDILIPDANYKYVLDKVSLSPKYQVIKNDGEIETDEKIVSQDNLKKDVLETFNKLKEVYKNENS